MSNKDNSVHQNNNDVFNIIIPKDFDPNRKINFFSQKVADIFGTSNTFIDSYVKHLIASNLGRDESDISDDEYESFLYNISLYLSKRESNILYQFNHNLEDFLNEICHKIFHDTPDFGALKFGELKPVEDNSLSGYIMYPSYIKYDSLDEVKKKQIISFIFNALVFVKRERINMINRDKSVNVEVRSGGGYMICWVEFKHKDTATIKIDFAIKEEKDIQRFIDIVYNNLYDNRFAKNKKDNSLTSLKEFIIDNFNTHHAGYTTRDVKEFKY